MMSIIEEINYTVRDEAEPQRLRRLAAPGAVLLCSARAPAAAGRGARSLAGAVSRAAPDRAGPADPDGTARRDARLRRVERDGARRSGRIARAGAGLPIGRRPPPGRVETHADRVTAPRPSARSHDHTAHDPRTPLRPRATDARAHSHASARVTRT